MAKREISPLLNKNMLPVETTHLTQYGTVIVMATDTADVQCNLEDNKNHLVNKNNKEARKQQCQCMQEQGRWWSYLKDFALFIPYVIPLKDQQAQTAMSITLFCIMAKHFLNVLTLRQLGIITNKLANSTGAGELLCYDCNHC